MPRFVADNQAGLQQSVTISLTLPTKLGGIQLARHLVQDPRPWIDGNRASLFFDLPASSLALISARPNCSRSSLR